MAENLHGAFFVSDYQTMSKKMKSEDQFLHFIIGIISGLVFIMAHPVCAQNGQKTFQKFILICQMILLKGYDILMKNIDFF